MKILLFGKNGQLGRELHRSLQPLGEVIALTRQQADFSKPDELREVVRKTKPDVIVNAVAYTAVDKAEDEEPLATTINGAAVGVLAEAARESGALLLHYSTDYVFDGSKASPYTEDDVPNPVNAYGRSKLAGEQAIKNVEPDHVILRIAWIYSMTGNNFLLTMLRLMRERESLNVVDDQVGTPTWSRLIAEASAHVIRQSIAERAEASFKSGLYHLGCTGSTSWHGFASRIREFSLRDDRPGESCEILKTSSAEFATRAERPANSRLSIERFCDHFGLTMPDWVDGLALCMDAEYGVEWHD
jgi:dTDP-4-dehydrorhamnose reductase